MNTPAILFFLGGGIGIYGFFSLRKGVNLSKHIFTVVGVMAVIFGAVCIYAAIRTVETQDTTGVATVRRLLSGEGVAIEHWEKLRSTAQNRDISAFYSGIGKSLNLSEGQSHDLQQWVLRQEVDVRARDTNTIFPKH